jgi:hypothetical protein
MKEPSPLKPGGGVYAQEGFEESLLAHLQPGELLELGPVRWLKEPRALAYPQKGPDRQYEFFAGVSQRGLHVWMHKWDGDCWTVADHHLWRFEQMRGLKARQALRAGRGFRARDERVVLLQLWDRKDGEFFCESVYDRAWPQLQALAKGVQAENDRLEAEQNQKAATTAGDELTRLAALHRDGALTDAEWERAKARFLGLPPDAKLVAMDEIDRLYRLRKSGAISDYEFGRKKLELLTW